MSLIVWMLIVVPGAFQHQTGNLQVINYFHKEVDCLETRNQLVRSIKKAGVTHQSYALICSPVTNPIQLSKESK